MAWSEHDHASVDRMVEALAEQFNEIAAAAIAERGLALFALAGGATPLPLYRRWASMDLDWRRIRVLPTDERCVPHGHPACNASALAAAFSVSGSDPVLPLTTPDGDADASEHHARELLARFPHPFDAVLLGMGNDAHTASLFPGATNLAAALSTDGPDAWRIDPQPLPPEAPFPRVTLAAQRLLRSRNVFLMITGAGKRSVLHEAQQRPDPLRKPISSLLHAPQAQIDIHWSPS